MTLDSNASGKGYHSEPWNDNVCDDCSEDDLLNDDENCFNDPHDDLIQFPEGLVDSNRFSDGSLVCIKDGKIEAVMLTEEQDERIDVTYIHSTDGRYILDLFSVLKRM